MDRMPVEVTRSSAIREQLPWSAEHVGPRHVGPRFADDVLGINRFGASAPASDVFEVVGVTVDAVVSRVPDLLRGNHGAG